jgi:rSAM/selenodomain-associated transferase 2
MPSISAIIIARNEERHLPRLIQRLGEMPQVKQIILSDGGSTDATISIARNAGARVVSGQGRGAQLNAGAKAAKGEILWFLHADCLPARSCGAQMMASVGRGDVGGHFRVRFDSPSIWARVFERIARVQAHLGIFYGDSGIWSTQQAFEQLGGFQDWPLFEDLDFARRLRKVGRVETLAGRLRVSSRRFDRRPMRTLGLWLELQIRWELGQSPELLARLYRERF